MKATIFTILATVIFLNANAHSVFYNLQPHLFTDVACSIQTEETTNTYNFKKAPKKEVFAASNAQNIGIKTLLREIEILNYNLNNQIVKLESNCSFTSKAKTSDLQNGNYFLKIRVSNIKVPKK